MLCGSAARRHVNEASHVIASTLGTSGENAAFSGSSGCTDAYKNSNPAVWLKNKNKT
jgi:hypothetical protein